MPSTLKSQNSSHCEAVDAVRDALDRSNRPGLRMVRCEFCHGTVTLRGTVSSFTLKQLAQEIARRTAGVVAVDNRLDVP